MSHLEPVVKVAFATSSGQNLGLDDVFLARERLGNLLSLWYEDTTLDSDTSLNQIGLYADIIFLSPHQHCQPF